MSKVKFLVDGKEDSAGHINEVIAIDAVTIHSAKNYSFVSVQLNKYKDTKSKLEGKSSSVDRVKPEKLFASDLGVSAIDFNNMLVDVIAAKHSLNTVEVETELVSKSPAEVKKEKAEAKAAQVAKISKETKTNGTISKTTEVPKTVETVETKLSDSK